jgi:hypothetical protein
VSGATRAAGSEWRVHMAVLNQRGDAGGTPVRRKPSGDVRGRRLSNQNFKVETKSGNIGSNLVSIYRIHQNNYVGM